MKVERENSSISHFRFQLTNLLLFFYNQFPAYKSLGLIISQPTNHLPESVLSLQSTCSNKFTAYKSLALISSQLTNHLPESVLSLQITCSNQFTAYKSLALINSQLTNHFPESVHSLHTNHVPNSVLNSAIRCCLEEMSPDINSQLSYRHIYRKDHYSSKHSKLPINYENVSHFHNRLLSITSIRYFSLYCKYQPV